MQEGEDARRGDEKEPHTQTTINFVRGSNTALQGRAGYVDTDAAKLEDVMGAYERFLEDPLSQ